MGRRWHSLAFAIATIAAAGAVVFGCSLLTSYDGYGGEDPRCPARRAIPQPPTSPATRGITTLTGAMRTARFLFIKRSGNQISLSVPTGYDIDNTCSNAADPRSGSCVNPSGVISDQPGTGGDNAIGENLPGLILRSELLSQLGNTDVDPIGDGCRAGVHGLVVVVSGYDGTDNDDKVTVDVANVLGVNGKSDGTGVAKFDGTDEFLIDGDDFTSGTLSANGSDTAAFIRNRVLYATIKGDFAIRLVAPNQGDGGAPFVATTRIPFTQMQIIGRIEKDARGLVINNATITGRMKLKSTFQAIFDYGLCPENGNFSGIAEKVCSFADVVANPDPARTNQKCDAVSFAFEATIAPAQPLAEANKRKKPDAGALCPTSIPPTCD